MGGGQFGIRVTGMYTSLKTSRDEEDGPEAMLLCNSVKAFPVLYVNLISIERGGAVHGINLWKQHGFWSVD